MAAFMARMLKDKALFPLTACVGLGAAIMCVQLYRASFKYPDVSFDRTNNPHPWLHVKQDQRVKLMGHRDLKTVEREQPPKF